MAGTTTETTSRAQRRRQRQDVSAADSVEPRDGEAVADADDGAPDVVEHTLDAGLGESEANLQARAAEMEANDGAEVVHGVNLDLEPPIDPRFDTDWERIVEEDLPEPPVTVVVLNLGRHGGRRRIRLQHRPGCPGRTERVESYPVKAPSGRKGVMTRCQDCAEQTYTRVT